MEKYNDVNDPGKDLDFKRPEFFRNKRFLITAGVIFLLAVAGAIYGIVVLNDLTASEEVLSESEAIRSDQGESAAAEVVEVLPQLRRNIIESDQNSWVASNPMNDPFAEPMKLTGIVIGGRGGNMAIIESGGSSFIVTEGDYVDDLWAVIQIKRGMTVLRAYNQEVSLYLDQPTVTRSLDSLSETDN